jgi:hypothetical protein
MKRFLVVLFMLLGCSAFSKEITAKEVTSFTIDIPHVYASSDIGINKKSVVSQIADELKNDFSTYKIISNNGKTEVTSEETGTNPGKATGTARDDAGAWHVNVEIVTAGTVYPIAYSVRMSFQEFDQINSTAVGVCIRGDFDKTISIAISSVIKELASKFYNLKGSYK